MTFGPEDVTRLPGEPWSAYQSRMLDLLGPEEKRAARRRAAEWKDRYALWLSRMRETRVGWNPPADSDTWRKWRLKKTATPEGVAICREWREAHSLELAERRELEQQTAAKLERVKRKVAKLELAERRIVKVKRKPVVARRKPVKRKCVVRRKVAKPAWRKITARLEPANQREIDQVLYSRWLHRMLAKHGGDWTPAPCVNTWRKWLNRRREKV